MNQLPGPESVKDVSKEKKWPPKRARKIASHIMTSSSSKKKTPLLPVLSRPRHLMLGKDRKPTRRAEYKKTRRPSSFFKTDSFMLKGQELFIARGYSAIPMNDFKKSMGRKITSINNHIIFKGSNTQGLPVIQDPIKMIKGFATGHIIVKVKPEVNLSELVNKYDLDVHYTSAHLNLISFIPKDKSRLLEISAKLAESSFFNSVKLDISYGAPHAK